MVFVVCFVCLSFSLEILFDFLFNYPENSFFLQDLKSLIRFVFFEGKHASLGKLDRYALLALGEFSVIWSQWGILAKEVLFVHGKPAIIKRAEIGWNWWTGEQFSQGWFSFSLAPVSKTAKLIPAQSIGLLGQNQQRRERKKLRLRYMLMGRVLWLPGLQRRIFLFVLKMMDRLVWTSCLEQF